MTKSHALGIRVTRIMLILGKLKNIQLKLKTKLTLSE